MISLRLVFQSCFATRFPPNTSWSFTSRRLSVVTWESCPVGSDRYSGHLSQFACIHKLHEAQGRRLRMTTLTWDRRFCNGCGCDEKNVILRDLIPQAQAKAKKKRKSQRNAEVSPSHLIYIYIFKGIRFIKFHFQVWYPLRHQRHRHNGVFEPCPSWYVYIPMGNLFLLTFANYRCILMFERQTSWGPSIFALSGL
jgi:hypothetical protein